jgi:NitT/TauT family transport system substrate-binding protein
MSMSDFLRFGRVAAVVAMVAATSAASGRDVRVGVLKFGTVHWELDVIETHRLDEAHGIDLQIVELGSKRATAVALQGGAADLIVTDWIWVSRQRAEGRNYAFVPYSLAVGGLIVRPDAGITELTHLRNRRVGVAGGPVDKSWLLLQAYAEQAGMDLSESVEPIFGAPPLLNELIVRGDLPAVLNFWHYNARLKALGMQELLTTAEILPALGVERPIPLLGWVFNRDWAERNREALAGFLRSSYSAKHLLLESDAEWERLEPKMKVSDAVTAAALRDAYRRGIPRRFGEADREAAARAFAILAREGGAKLVGPSNVLTPGTFWTGFDPAQWRQ